MKNINYLNKIIHQKDSFIHLKAAFKRSSKPFFKFSTLKGTGISGIKPIPSWDL